LAFSGGQEGDAPTDEGERQRKERNR
jgi:hypothetical protein